MPGFILKEQMSISCFTVSRLRVQVCGAGAMRTCPCYLLCDLTPNKGTHRETGLPYLDSWKKERVAISSVCVLGRQRQWGPWACLAAPAHRSSHQTVGNPMEASVPDVSLGGAFGTYSWGSDTLGFPELLGEGPLVPSQLSDSKQLLRSRQFLPLSLRTLKDHLCPTHIPRTSARMNPGKQVHSRKAA